MKTRKILAFALAAIIVAGLFAACGGAAPAEPAPAPAASAAPAAPAAPAPAPAPAPEPAAETTKIRVEIFDRGTDDGKTDPADNYYSKWIQDKALAELNLEVEFVKVSRWEETDQINVLMAAGTAPDISMTYSNELIAGFRDMGGLIDLEPYIDSMLPDLKAFLGPDTAVPGKDLIRRNKLLDSGAVFSIPSRRMNVAGENTFIRKDWLDKLGLPLPATTEEFHQALIAFKQQDPGGIGADNVIPFILTTDVRWRARNLLTSFLDPNMTPKDRWVNTVVDRELLLPGYKEGVRFLNQMFNEGLIDPEFPLYDDDVTNDNLIQSGVVGAYIHNWDQDFRESPGLYKGLAANVPGASYVVIDPFVNAAGKTFKSCYDPSGLNFFIPSYSENVDGALRYMNWLSKFENRYFLQIGNEGVTHKMVNGVPPVISATGPEIMNSAMNIDYTFMINGLDTGNPDLNTRATALSYAVDESIVQTAYDTSLKDAEPMLVVPGLTLTAAGPVTQTLIDKDKALLCEAITAPAANFDAVWDAGIADWLASGAQAVIDERAAKYYE
jgi:putative aldouronate transport system substrate-binding protein